MAGVLALPATALNCDGSHAKRAQRWPTSNSTPRLKYQLELDAEVDECEPAPCMATRSPSAPSGASFFKTTPQRVEGRGFRRLTRPLAIRSLDALRLALTRTNKGGPRCGPSGLGGGAHSFTFARNPAAWAPLPTGALAGQLASHSARARHSRLARCRAAPFHLQAEILPRFCLATRPLLLLFACFVSR